ncbi:MAG: cyclic nucleotide-binding domain-containing protein [Bdellovibrionales bacterium]
MPEPQKYLHFAEGTRIINKDDPANRLFMVMTGQVRVFLEDNGKQVALATLGPESIFGEAAIFENAKYHANVEAIDETQLFVMTPETLSQKLQEADPMIRALLKMLMERLHTTNEALLKSETREFMDIGFA